MGMSVSRSRCSIDKTVRDDADRTRLKRGIRRDPLMQGMKIDRRKPQGERGLLPTHTQSNSVRIKGRLLCIFGRMIAERGASAHLPEAIDVATRVLLTSCTSPAQRAVPSIAQRE
jgi:hypothetical protein